MSSDRARVTYDPRRHYTGVVAQQGRVSLEADWNEAQAISGAEIEARTLDFIGRAASPDNGYQIKAMATGDLQIRCGTVYLGGQRLSFHHEPVHNGRPDRPDDDGKPDRPDDK